MTNSMAGATVTPTPLGSVELAVAWPTGEPDEIRRAAFDLTPEQARDLARVLYVAASEADQATENMGVSQ